MALAEWQLVRVAEHEPLRHIDVAESLLAAKIVAVLNAGIGEIDRKPRAGVGKILSRRVCGQQAESPAESAAQLELHRVIAGVALVDRMYRDIAKLRKWPQKLAVSNGSLRKCSDRDQAEE